MDSGQKNKSEIVQMIDDGYGGMIKIPSIFIDEADGEKILKLLNMESINEIIFKIDFKLV